MDVNARNLISLDWDIYLNEWRLSFFEISSEFDFQQKFLNGHFALDLLLSGFWRQNVFWNFISKQVDLISGIMSLSRMYFNTVFRQFFFKIPSLFWFPTKFMWGWTLVVTEGDKIWTPMPPPSHQWGHHCPPIRPHCQLTRPDFSP